MILNTQRLFSSNPKINSNEVIAPQAKTVSDRDKCSRRIWFCSRILEVGYLTRFTTQTQTRAELRKRAGLVNLTCVIPVGSSMSRRERFSLALA